MSAFRSMSLSRAIGSMVSFSAVATALALGGPTPVMAATPPTPTAITRLFSPDQGGVGQDVAMSPDGTSIAVGATSTEDGLGSIEVYSTDDGWLSYTREAVLTPSAQPTNGELGYSVAFSSDGNTIVGAPTQGGFTSDVYVFTKAPGTDWVDAIETAILSSPVGSDSFSASVAVSGNGSTIVVGAPAGGGTPGSAYVFESSNGWSTFTRTAKLTDADSAQMGNSVAISNDGSTIVAGDPSAPVGDAPFQGVLNVFSRPAGGWSTWTQASSPAAMLTDAGAATLGWSVAISANGDTIIGGAPQTNSGADSRGGAWVFGRGATWADDSSGTSLPVTASGCAFACFAGWSVALSGDGRIASFGGQGADVDSDSGVGIVEQYYSDDSWVTATKLATLSSDKSAAGDQQGTSVSMSSDGAYTASGAPNSESGAGAVFLFGPAPTDPCDGYTGAELQLISTPTGRNALCQTIFLADGTFTVPASRVNTLDIVAVGGGGGGGGSNIYSAPYLSGGGGGGGGGGVSLCSNVTVTAGDVLTVTVGAGGTGGPTGYDDTRGNGNVGFDSTIRNGTAPSLCTGVGGSGGKSDFLGGTGGDSPAFSGASSASDSSCGTVIAGGGGAGAGGDGVSENFGSPSVQCVDDGEGSYSAAQGGDGGAGAVPAPTSGSIDDTLFAGWDPERLFAHGGGGGAYAPSSIVPENDGAYGGNGYAFLDGYGGAWSSNNDDTPTAGDPNTGNGGGGAARSPSAGKAGADGGSGYLELRFKPERPTPPAPTTLYVVPANASATYGDASVAFTFSYRTVAGDAGTVVADPTSSGTNSGFVAPTCNLSPTPYSSSTPAGTYTGGIACTGGSGGALYTLDRTGVATLTVAAKPVTITYTGPSTSTTSASVTLTASVSPDPGCAVKFSGIDPVTNASFGPVSAVSSGGTASASATVAAGVYIVTVELDPSGSCSGTADTSGILTVTASMGPGAAWGGGWYTPTNGKPNFGFVVQNFPKSGSTPATTKGQLVWVVKNQWKFKGRLTSYTAGSGSTPAMATGTGTLYYWQKSGTGGNWVPATSTATSVTIKFTATTPSTKKSTGSPGTFGIGFTGTKVSGSPTLPVLPTTLAVISNGTIKLL